MKKLTVLIASLVSVVALTAGATAKPVSAFKDPAGDTGLEATGPIPELAEGGFDLTGGTIEKVGKDIVFTVSHASMPSSNQPGEAVRFLWHFDVKGKQYRFTVKSLDIGKPDAAAQTGTERVGQVYSNGVARLEEGYTEATPANLTLSQFGAVDYFDVTFDAAKATISWKMPLASLKLKPGSSIDAGTGGSTATGCQICWVAHYAERSLTPHTVLDAAVMTTGYKIPK
ncbi:MAG TPA: hypothetical protein VE174_11995 [Actinomycetota bacterium]|nr:hypothetical protein [Actinomycetota bacterium]